MSFLYIRVMITREQVEKAGYNQRSLAKKLGAHYNTVGNWIRRKFSPHPLYKKMLLKLFKNGDTESQ